MKTLTISATRQSDYKQTILFQSIESLKAKKIDVGDIMFIVDNKRGLSEVYNKIIREHSKDYDCILFVHDDLYIDDAFVFDKISDGFAFGYDIIGIAGGHTPTIHAPILWHIMCKSLHGAAGHFSPDMSSIHISSFGTTPARVAMLDGLFLAINTKTTQSVGWKFNENYDFHIYDIASCLDANIKHLKMGVMPIHVVHKSPGLSNISDECFQRNQSKFLEEYDCK